MATPISGFRDAYRFLSNFTSVHVIYDSELYPSVEHAYQAAKTNDLHWRRKIQAAPSPQAAKRMGRLAPVREDWEDAKLGVMEMLLRQKFATPYYKILLMQTDDRELIEDNWWGDKFWGVCNGVGENHLGKLLMKIRADL